MIRQPPQIQSMNGLCCTLTSQAPPLERIAERDIQVARQAGIDRRLGHHLVLHAVDAPLRIQHRDRLAVARHARPWRAPRRSSVPSPSTRPRGGTRSRASSTRFAGLHPHVLLALVALHQRHADHEHRDADVRDDHAVVRTGLPPGFPEAEQRRESTIQIASARPKPTMRAPVAEQRTAAAGRAPGSRASAQRSRTASSGRLGALPARERPDAHQEQRRRHAAARTRPRSTAARPRSCRRRSASSASG